jgi:hypothetical protein
MAALARFRALPSAQRRLLVRAALTLALMRAAIRLPFATLSRLVGLDQGEAPELVEAVVLARAAEIGWAVRTAAAHVPFASTCLMQGLAAAALLRRRRIEATLYLGVAKESGAVDGLSAHAWLRCGELVLTGAAGRAAFTPIASFASSGPKQRVSAHRQWHMSGVGR